MFKYQKFTFDKIPVKRTWSDFPCFGKQLTTDGKVVAEDWEVDIKLNPEDTYQLSMDQSSSNTGIFIKNYDNTEAYMIEMARDKKNKQTAEDFIFQLEAFLHRLFEGQTLTHVVYEQPINSHSFRSAQVLFQLEGMIRSLPKRYPEFKIPKLDCIVNSSWRSVVIDDNITGHTRKECSRISVQQIWQWTRDYGYSLGADEDVYEAIGIMMGWFYKAFDALGRPYVRGATATRTLGALVLPNVNGEQAIKLLEDQGIKAKLFIANPENPIYRNIAAMVEHYDVVCVEFSDPYSILSICIESNIVWVGYDKLTLIMSDAACVNAKLRDISGGEFNFVI